MHVTIVPLLPVPVCVFVVCLLFLPPYAPLSPFLLTVFGESDELRRPLATPFLRGPRAPLLIIPSLSEARRYPTRATLARDSPAPNHSDVGCRWIVFCLVLFFDLI